MILDKIENADLYYDSVPGMQRFMQFFNDNDLEAFPAGKLRLDGDDLFVNIIDLQGKPVAEVPMEAHKDYIDIQIPLTDAEPMGYKAREDCQEVIQEYDEGKDVELYSDEAVANFVVPVGYFAVFFPSDGHRPGLIGEGKTLRKLIVKTRVIN
jgi:YhcH/YjgK/YiaL family protein